MLQLSSARLAGLIRRLYKMTKLWRWGFLFSVDSFIKASLYILYISEVTELYAIFYFLEFNSSTLAFHRDEVTKIGIGRVVGCIGALDNYVRTRRPCQQYR